MNFSNLFKKILVKVFSAAAVICGVFCVNADGPLLAQDGSSHINASVQPAVCGDGIKGGDEQCDGNDMAAKSCKLLGYAGGELLCKASCEFNFSRCVKKTKSSGGGGGGGSSNPLSSASVAGTPATTVAPGSAAILTGDLNYDGKVDLVDFSIEAYWYGREFFSMAKICDLNSDSKVDLADFSIMAYYWTK